MRKLAIVLALITSLTVPALCQAITLGFSPNTQTRYVGDVLSVDVVVSGLHSTAAPQIVSAYDLDVTFDSTILSNTYISWSSQWLGDLNEALFDVDFHTGRTDFFFLSFLSDADLQAIQGDSVTLATLGFTALNVGTSNLRFDAQTFPGIDVKGLNAEKLDLDVFDGKVIVTDNGTPAVPEPSTFILFCAGLAGAGLLRRRMKC